MQMRKNIRNGDMLSSLGFGCMRLPRTISIDERRSEKLIVSAVERGVNYFDTAYIYPGSEEALGAVIERNGLREKIFLATKLPHQLCRDRSDFERIFSEQKSRLRTGRIDYYLIHNLGSADRWRELCGMGIREWISDIKASGEIANIGFSFHGISSSFTELLGEYDWDFCQIQYNYVNENYQAGRAGLEAAYSRGVPVMVMEPLLGGKLAAGLPKKAAAAFEATGFSPAQEGLRWLWDQSGVCLTLSGMNAMEQLDENIAACEGMVPGSLGEAERKAIAEARREFQSSYKVPCTGCSYCMPCPQGVNIPGCFAAYNMSFSAGYVAGMTNYMTSTAANRGEDHHRATRCIGCGECEKKCPQHIPVASQMARVRKKMEPFWMGLVIRAVNAGSKSRSSAGSRD